MNKMEHEYVWNHKAYRNLIIDTRTGKRAKHRKIKERYRSKLYRAKLIHGLQLKVGDIVQTCYDGFNHRIVSLEVESFYPWDRKKKDDDLTKSEIQDVSFICEKGRSHSWMNCCSPALRVSDIEKEYMKEFPPLEQYLLWYGNNEEGEKFYTKHKNFDDMMKSRITNKLPITDEYGMLLPELEKESQ